ncbi:DNA-binding HxlR family transcriptional regulator [Catenulispora sp. EB89]|uniref:winged helix-turn-helix transcriptional regulator n=1 Tax=Catenulispora sp. EB89 TaxID=3156257 RepID=UPI003514BF5F
MTKRQATQEPCPVMRTVDLVGDRWTLLILRDAFDGPCRFSQLQRSLGIAKNILSDRLAGLVDAGILTTEPAADSSAYQAYALTDKGRDLFDVIIALRQWGEQYAFDPGEEYRPLIDQTTGEPLRHVAFTREDGSAVRPSETTLGELRPIAAAAR